MQPPATTQQPHRPGPLHQTNKTHKGGRHTRKSSATSEIKSKSIARPIAKLRREERLNQLHQNRKLKRERCFDEKRKLGTESQPPLQVCILNRGDKNSHESFFNLIKNYDDETSLKVKVINDRSMYAASNRLRMRFKLITLDTDNFDESLDIVKSVDLLMMLHTPESVDDEDDFKSSELMRAIHMHCLPTVVHVLNCSSDNNDGQSSKKVLNAKRILKSRVEDDKLHCIEKSQDLMQLFHIMGNCKRLKSIFKDARPTIVPDLAEMQNGNLTFLGFVRRKLLSPNDLIHVTGYGDFQIKQIDILPDVVSLRPASKEGLEIVETLRPDPMKQETLDQENEIEEGEQTWPTAEELAEVAERKNTKKVVKNLPPGTSDYQGAWIPDESEDDKSESESEDELEDGQEKMEDLVEDEESDKDELESDDEIDAEVESVVAPSDVAMDVDDYDKIHNADKESKVLEKFREARMEEMFPDEIDTPPDVPARVRFARYRGLKSFRTSAWDPQENLPPDYSRIFQFQNFQRTKRRVLNTTSTEGADPGQYVRIHLSAVSAEVATSILSRSVPPTLVGLLNYERKMTVMNLLIKRVIGSNVNHPIKSKDELIFYVGFRKFKARPIFTTHSMSPKFKYERFLRDDVAMVATLYAPITFPPAPVLVFRENYKGDRELVASGSVLDSNPDRMVIKRIRLSGHPFKINSKSAVVRFMFFNSEDVMYFKPVELVTKYSRRGHISESLGTHGHMKCTFDKKIRSDDCIFMNLYKRIFPKWTYQPLCQA